MRRLLVGSFLCIAACSSATVAPVTPNRVPVSTDFTTDAERRALFDSLVADVRKNHVFAEATQKNLGRRWEDDLPTLERDFIEARTEGALTIALTRFNNALHDAHCGFEPEATGKSVVLPIGADVEWRDNRPFFYVSRVDDPEAKAQVSRGDEIRSVDGVVAADLVSHHMLVSRQNNLRGVTRDVVTFLARRRSTETPATAGSVSTWVVRSSKTGSDVTLYLRWTEGAHEGFDDFSISYDRPTCSGLAARDYGPYEVTARGQNFCVYESHVPAYRPYPIVRQFSFMYIPSSNDVEHVEHRVRADHDILVETLTRIGPKGVLLDLRDNGGGNNPNWFMDWYASGPYVDRFVLTRLSDDFTTEAKVRDAGIGHAHAYLEDLGRRSPDQTFTPPRPFFKKPNDPAWDNRYMPSHRVTTAPVALLVGPRCMSSCDSIAFLFAENHFGPLVGEPTAAAYTTLRIRRPVTIHGKPFGVIHLAFTRELSGKTHEAVEGVPIHLDVPIDRTLANRGTYDRTLVDAAIKAL
jgi:Peptidase family S41